MAVALSPIGGAGSQFFDNNGNPLSGGKIYTYEAGTTTPAVTYTTLAGTTAHTNPIILDSAGRVPGGEIWLTLPDRYKFVLKTSADVTIGTYDNIQGYSSGSIAYAATEVQIATANQTLFVLTEMFYNPGTNTLAVFIDGVNQVVNNSYVESTPTSVTFMSGLHVGAIVKFVNLNVASTDATTVSYEPGFVGSVATTVAAKLQQTVSVKDFGAVGDGVTDDSTAVQNALNASKNVYFPDGTYLVNGPNNSSGGMEMQDGQCLIGESVNAVLLQGTIRFLLTAGKADGGTPNPADNKKNIRVSNLTLQNNAGTFNEFRHLMMLSAVSDVVIEKCNFIGFEGDAIYLGSGISAPGIERHNVNVTIQDCLFDGVNNVNRNGVTIIDGDGVLIQGCKFLRCTRSDMPGPIDFEPDTGASYAIGRNITVQNCTFESCLGAAAFFYYTIPAGILTTPPAQIKFNNNYVDSTCVFSGTVIYRTRQTISDDTKLMGFEVNGNYFGTTSGSAISATGVRGVTVNDNTFESSGVVVFGALDSTSVEPTYDVDFCGNTLRNSGNVDGMLLIGTTKRINIESNVFSKPRASLFAIRFYGTGATTTSSYVTIQNNQFVKNTTTPQTHSVGVVSHTFTDPTTNRWFGNVTDDALINSFQFSYAEIEQVDFQNAVESTVLGILPDSYRLGESWNFVNGDATAPDANKQGVIRTLKLSTSAARRKFVVQDYYPANNGATSLKDLYWRKGEDASNAWSAWVKVTGV